MMSKDQLEAFLEAVRSDPALQERLKAAVDLDEVCTIGRDLGFAFSVDELELAQAEISDEEIEGVTGGTAVAFAVAVHTIFGLGLAGLGIIYATDRCTHHKHLKRCA